MILETLQEALKNKFDTEFRDGIHVSDLVMCGRKAADRRLNPKPLTMRELNYFTSGRAIGDSLAILARSNDVKYEAEKEIKFKDIVAHIDIYDSEHNIPIECKSARMKEMKEPKPHYVDQLKSYMAMTNSDKGILLIQLLLNFDDKPFVEFEIEMNDSQRRDQLQKLLFKAALFAEALERKDPMLAHGVYFDSSLNWLCRDCPLKAKCAEFIKCECGKEILKKELESHVAQAHFTKSEFGSS